MIHCRAESSSDLLDVTSSVVGGRLQVSVLYSEVIHKRETMAGLIREYLTQLRRRNRKLLDTNK